MNRRILLSGMSALALFVSLTTLPAFADGGDDNGGDDSGKDDGGVDDGGKDGGGSDGGGHGDDGGGGSGGGGGSSGSGSGKTGSGGSKGSEDGGRAIDASGALPLGDMLALFQQRGHATVLDVRLSRSNETLLYVFKYIDGAGTVRKSYFDARTGALVQ